MIDLNDLAYKMRNVAYARKMNGGKVDTDTMAMLKHCANEPTIDIENALQKCFEKNLARAEGRGDKK